jgi:hypothetical protein
MASKGTFSSFLMMFASDSCSSPRPPASVGISGGCCEKSMSAFGCFGKKSSAT